MMTQVTPVAMPGRAAPRAAAAVTEEAAITAPARHANPKHDRPGIWLYTAAASLLVLIGGTAAVGFSARYRLVHAAWWDKRAPGRTGAGRTAATVARSRPTAGNWCTGVGLDRDELDTPGCKPANNWKPATGTGIAPGIQSPARRRKSHGPRDIKQTTTKKHAKGGRSWR